MFRWLDLLFPIGIFALAAVLAVWVTVRGAPTGALASTWGLFGVVALGGVWLYIVRWRSRRCDFQLGAVRVRLGERNAPTREKVTAWLHATLVFWQTDGYAVTRRKLGTSVFGSRSVYLVFSDSYVIELKAWGMLVRGWTRDGVAVVGIHPGMTAAEDEAYISALVRHEFSHLILSACGVPGERHHALFSEYGLGA